MSEQAKCRGGILVVEDQEDIRETLKDILLLEGYRVSTACNGQEAIDILHEEKERFGLVLLDLMMPVLSGAEFLETRRHDPALKDVPVLVISAIADQNKAALASAFLRKPFELNTLLQAVDRYCAESA